MVLYRIDPERSRVWIDAKSSLHPIRAETAGVEGSFEADMLVGGLVDPGVPPHVRLELPVRKLSSGNPLYDREMQRRIDARRFPTITGVLTDMKETGRTGSYRVTGQVSFRGVTRSVEDEMSLSMADQGTLRLEGAHVFDIRDFGMTPPRILTLRVHPEVSVRVSLLASREG